MAKKLYIFATLFILSLTHTLLAQNKNLYDFKVKDIDGKAFDLSSLKGKKVLIVNVASKCGLTPQYAQLEELYQKYKDQGLVILGFPSNDFKEQEPGTNAEIKEFCTLNYGVTFPIMDKVKVVGENKIPLYQWLTEKKQNGKFDAEVQWNFQKFMINADGSLAGYVLPKGSPLSSEIIDWIEKP
ncbi:glutathione peroxidase [Dysgonomonas macrotermitis]|uniref:Glutathione peroxidase n=1 Tax=Dysgonomonas macrotermitis TaxID=1346286 RepID=A0A1M5AT53_9BACT|nr:glutathione peroxidase [Dysgonomonas macrotermitis]SHF33448.1 glutathione peroxidase [Dysgonomonas macrotermitis]